MTFNINQNNIFMRVNHVIVATLFLTLFTVLLACDNDEINEAERVKSILIGSAWNVESVFVSGTDQTSVYSGLQINFSDTGYTAQNGGSVWTASGTWNFTDETAKAFLRNDGLSVSIIELEQKKLVLELTWDKTTLGSGRIASVDGRHTFTLVRP